MGRASDRENPFQPGAGARPPLLAGRTAELALADSRLDSLERGRRPPRGLLFFGPRGNGKTCLLHEIADNARRRGMRAESLPAASFRDPDSLWHQLTELAGLAGTRLTDAQAAGFGVSAEPRVATRNVSKLLTGWIRRKSSRLVILLDEAHAVEPAAGRIFFDAVQAATRDDAPFLLLAAGTPDAPRRIRKAGTLTERMFERAPVGRLARAETMRALSEPARVSGLPLREDAAALLAAASQDYPYFVQLLGDAAWSAADADGLSEISGSAARLSLEAVGPQIERFYAERLDEARGRRIEGVLAPLAALVRERGGFLGELELRPALARLAAPHGLPGDETWLLENLSDLGVLWRGGPGRWELGIPSFGDYLLALPGAVPGSR